MENNTKERNANKGAKKIVLYSGLYLYTLCVFVCVLRIKAKFGCASALSSD